MKKSIARIAFALSLLLAMAMPAFAAEEKAKEIADKPAKVLDRSTPITIEHEGSDSLGAALNMRLKERFNESNLFSLQEKDMPKFRILLSTVPEFEDRPYVGSAYSVVWVFSQSDGTLRHYISREVGVLTPADIDALVTKILEKSDGLAVRYAYLFPKK